MRRRNGIFQTTAIDIAIDPKLGGGDQLDSGSLLVRKVAVGNLLIYEECESNELLFGDKQTVDIGTVNRLTPNSLALGGLQTMASSAREIMMSCAKKMIAVEY